MDKTLEFELDRANKLILEMTAGKNKALTLTGSFRQHFNKSVHYHLDYSLNKLIEEYELIDHGVEHSQFFQGCGVSLTKFTDIATGYGENPAEAINDALEQLAGYGYDVDELERRILEDEGWKEFPIDPNAHIDCEPEHGETCKSDCEEFCGHGDCELQYLVSIRVK